MKESALKTNPVAAGINLQFPQDKDKYIVSVDLGHHGEPGQRIHHFLYGSQVYDTMFGIFGTFEGKRTEHEFVIEKISLELVNFRGMINVGFTDDPITFGKAPAQLSDQPFQDNSFYFFVQGTSLMHNKDLTFETPISIPKGARHSVTFNRMLCPLPDSLAPVGDVGGRTPKGSIFDSEFYYRNGVDFGQQMLRAGQFNPRVPPVVSGSNGNGHAGSEVGMPSLRCHQSYVNLFY